MKASKKAFIYKKNRDINPLIWSLLVSYIVLSQIVYQIFNIEASRLSGLILLSPIFIMLFVTMMVNRGRIRFRFNYYHRYILVFGLFCLLSSFWAQSPTLAISKGIDIIEIFVIMTVISFCFYGVTDSVDPLLKAIMWGYYIVVFYEIVFYGWSYFAEVIKDASRVTSEYLNSNTLGMCASFAIIINYYLIITKRIPVWSIVLIVLGIVIIAASGSRKALISLLTGLFLYYFFRSIRKDQRRLPIVRFFILFPIIIFAVYEILQLSMFRGTMARIEGMMGIVSGRTMEKSASIRQLLNQLGWRLFKQHPILGIGIDNPRLYTYDIVGKTFYLHNNYVELLASGGLIGTLIYYSIYIKLLISYLRMHCFDEPEYCICLALLILILVLDFGMVTYYSKSTYVFLLLLTMYNEKLKKEESYGNKVKNSI